MKRFWPFVTTCLLLMGTGFAVTRDGAGVSRTQSGATQSHRGATTNNQAALLSRAGTISRGDMQPITTSVTPRTISTTSRAGAVTSRAAAMGTYTTGQRTTTQAPQSNVARTTSARATTTANRTATTQRSGGRTTTTADNDNRRTTTTARATMDAALAQSKTFGTGYTACRDAYFTCMDQFCATQNDSYRRCVCSSRLTDVQARERALSQTATQLQDFKDLNIAVIPNTAAEVKAMLSASEGEVAAANAKDTSASAKQLAGISGVLSSTKSKALSTAGTLDIAGNIDSIWMTTDFTGSINLANLTGEALYNAVHVQCVDLIADSCESTSTLNMVVSAYGMYIENDCSMLLNTLDKNKVQANSAIRETEREMNVARLENYDAHNSTSINDCIASVRADITNNAACGADYVHCLDMTGRYLNRDTGAPIYTAEFYQLEEQSSLSGDVLTNQANRLLVAELNKKRVFAKNSLETCRDLADDVWDEFMRQAIAEIHQGQQERIRQVKDECLDVVSTCYDEQAQSLKDFSNVKEQLLLGQRLELSEEMCREKLDACSNLYGGGTSGLAELVRAMYEITNQKISQNCTTTLKEFLTDLCSPPTTDTAHSYPYKCRDYTPGDAQYAAIAACNISDDDDNNNTEECKDYTGSMYHKLVLYALQACVRPGESTNPIPNHILADVNIVMTGLRADMSKALSAECTKLDEYWVDAPWDPVEGDPNTHQYNTGHEIYKRFYDVTGANKAWGYCATKASIENAASGNSSDTTTSSGGDTGGNTGGTTGGGNHELVDPVAPGVT